MNALSHLAITQALVAELEALPEPRREDAWLALSSLCYDCVADAPKGGQVAVTTAAHCATEGGFPAMVDFLFAHLDRGEAEVAIRSAGKLRDAEVRLDIHELGVSLDARAAVQHAALALMQKRFGGGWSPMAQARFLAAIDLAVQEPVARFIAAQRASRA